MNKIKIEITDIMEVLEQGDIICNGLNFEDRYYRYTKQQQLEYSDNLKDWKNSKSSLDKMVNSKLDKYKLIIG